MTERQKKNRLAHILANLKRAQQDYEELVAEIEKENEAKDNQTEGDTEG